MSTALCDFIDVVCFLWFASLSLLVMLSSYLLLLHYYVSFYNLLSWELLLLYHFLGWFWKLLSCYKRGKLWHIIWVCQQLCGLKELNFVLHVVLFSMMMATYLISMTGARTGVGHVLVSTKPKPIMLDIF